MIPPAVPQEAEEPKRPTEPFHGNFEMALPGTAAYVQELREYAAALRVRCDQQERNAKVLREAAEIAVEDKYLCDNCKDGLRDALSLVEAEGE